MNYKLLSLVTIIAATYALNNALNKSDVNKSEKVSSKTLSSNKKSLIRSNPWSESSVKAIKEKLKKYKHKSLMKNRILSNWLNKLGKSEYDNNFNYSEFFRKYEPACRYHMEKSYFKRSIKKVGKTLATINETEETLSGSKQLKV